MEPCTSGSRRPSWRTTASGRQTAPWGLCPQTPGVYRFAGPQQRSEKEKAVPLERHSPLLYVLPWSARVALLRSPILSKAEALYPNHDPIVHPPPTPGDAKRSFLSNGGFS